MPSADGRFRGISLAGLEIPWLEHTPASFADAVADCGCEHPLDCENRDRGCRVEVALAGCDCDGPCDLCIESDGVCQRGEDCQCKQGEKARPGW